MTRMAQCRVGAVQPWLSKRQMAKRFAAAGPYLVSAKGANASQQIGGVGGRLAKPKNIQPQAETNDGSAGGGRRGSRDYIGVGRLRQALKDALQNPRQAGWTRIGTSRKASFAVNSRSY